MALTDGGAVSLTGAFGNDVGAGNIGGRQSRDLTLHQDSKR